jgi:hypothetical protein
MTTFKRGDGVVFVRTVRDYVIGEPSRERLDITVGLVTSVTRDGKVKAYRHAGWRTDVKLHKGSLEHSATQYVLPANEVDMSAIMDYCANRPWNHAPQHLGAPFQTMDDVKTELRQFKTQQTEGDTQS